MPAREYEAIIHTTINIPSTPLGTVDFYGLHLAELVSIQ